MAENLKQSIAELAPDAQIVVAHTHDDALRARGPDVQVATAVIATTDQSFASSSLVRHLAQTGTRIMLAEPWDATLAHEKGWSILTFPFTTQDGYSFLSQTIQKDQHAATGQTGGAELKQSEFLCWKRTSLG